MKTWALISCTVTAQLICVFVFAYANWCFSHAKAQISYSLSYLKVLPLLFTGTTKAIIPIMDKMGIAALSIGVNGATVPASVPQVFPDSQPVFMWKTGNSSLLTFYHPGLVES